jgi:hypothetical protein
LSSCGCLLAPGGEAPRISSWFSPERVISYGMSSRDTLTLSSAAGNTYFVSLRRDTVALSGALVERQEFPVRFQQPVPLHGALAAAGALLLLGFPLEGLA